MKQNYNYNKNPFLILYITNFFRHSILHSHFSQKVMAIKNSFKLITVYSSEATFFLKNENLVKKRP